MGARSCIPGKNVDGLCTTDPKTDPDAELIPEITAGELIEMDLDDIALERMVPELMQETVHIRELGFVNCHRATSRRLYGANA